VLATASSSRLPWGPRRYFTRTQFDADLKRIVAFYKDRGFPDAKVTTFDVKMNDRQDAVDITITVDEGQPEVVEAIEYVGFDVVPPARMNGLRTRLPLRAGAPLDRALAQASRENALDEVRDHGFPYATVRLRDRQGSNDHARIVTFTATPGKLARYGEISIEGNSSVSDDVVRRQLTFRPNWRFRLSQLQESQRRLYSLETFNFVNVEADVTEGQQPETVPVTVTLTEAKARKINFGIGYGSEEHGRVSADWRHVNFFGGARTMQLKGAYSSLEKGGEANFRQPYIFGPRTSLTLTGQAWHRNEPAYVLDTSGGRATIERMFARRGPLSSRTGSMSMSASYTNEFESYQVSEEALNTPDFFKTLIALGLNPLTGTARGTLSSVGVNFNRNTTDNSLSANQGYVFNAHVEQAGKMLGGDFVFFESILEGRYFLPLGQFGVFAVKARAGSIGDFGPANLQVPFYRRYWLGGATSLRGWGRFDVAPLFEGQPIGGHSLVESSAEIRAPLWGNLSGVVFVDAGNVWQNAWAFHLGDLRYDVGPGLRYMTPIGPLRLDMGFQLNPIPGLLVNGTPETRHFRVHFSIGQAF